jgi:hypothetical protein
MPIYLVILVKFLLKDESLLIPGINPVKPAIALLLGGTGSFLYFKYIVLH